MAKEYFSHDYNARNDLKLVPVFRKYKLRGIGAYWCLVEMLYENDGYILFSEIKNIGFDLRERESFLMSIVTEFDLFVSDNEKFWSESVLKRLKMRNEKSIKASVSANKRWKENANALRPERDSNAIKESKVNEIKTKESKVKDLEQRTQDFWSELRDYFSEFTEKTVKDFFEHWSEPNKSQTKMKKELQETWDTRRRLVRWKSNEGKFGSKVQPKENKSDLIKQGLSAYEQIQNEYRNAANNSQQ